MSCKGAVSNVCHGSLFGSVLGIILSLFAIHSWANAAATTEPEKISAKDDPRPVVLGEEAITVKIFHKHRQDWYRRLTLEAYQKIGTKDPKWDAQVTAFVEASLPDFAAQTRRIRANMTLPKQTSTQPAPTTSPALLNRLQMGKALMDAGCRDGLVLYLYGASLVAAESLAEADKIFTQALEMLKDSQYDPLLVHICAFEKELILRHQRSKEENQRLMDLSAKNLARTITKTEYAPLEQRFVWELMDRWTNARFDKASQTPELLKHVDNHEKIDPWLLNMLLGKMEHRLAWDARGGGFANTVTNEGWQGFSTHLAKAKENYTQAWKINPSYPEPAGEMIEIAMAGGADEGEDIRTWFDRCVNAQFDYMPAYEAMLWALRPRWGGSHEQMLEFALECAETRRYDTDVPWEIYVAVLDIGGESRGDYASVLKSPQVYPALREMFEGYLKAASPSHTQEDALSNQAAVEWCAGNWSQAKLALDQVGAKIMPSAFERLGCVDGEMAISEVCARGGELQKDVALYEQAILDGDFEEAAAGFKKALESVKDERAKTYLRQRAWACNCAHALKGGDWVDFMPDKDFSGWHIKSGQWSVGPDGVLEGRSTPQGLVLMNDLAGPFRMEVKMNIEFVNAPYGCTNGGLLLVGDCAWHTYGALLFPYVKKTMVNSQGVAMDVNPPKNGDFQLQKNNELLVQIWDDELIASANGTPMTTGFKIENCYGKGRHYLAVGGVYWYDKPIIRISEIKGRLLTQRPNIVIDQPASPAQTEAN